MGNSERSSSGSGGSIKQEKKKKNGEKPYKKPQRGLGVAQLEKILHAQMGCNNNMQEDMRVQPVYPALPSYAFHPDMMVSACTDPSLGYSEFNTMPRWNIPQNGILENHISRQPNITRDFLNLHKEESFQEMGINTIRSNSMRQANQNYESNGAQEIDLELRLSL